MGNIRILPAILRNQIAAGEVVERPASVVKELVENSLDAGGTDIFIEIEGGGIEKILVRDNGSGMDEEDAILAFERHATSKIAASEDLFNLSTLGFRGEALASIASVARLTLITKQEESSHGIKVTNEDVFKIEKVAFPTGTEIRIEDLFYNVPARRKFLKSPQTENAHIAEIVEHIALANPHISFRLKMEGKIILDTPAQSGGNALFQRVSSILGKGISENLFAVHYLGELLKISGFVSHPHVHRRNRKSQRIFVNKRPITDRLIFAAISEGYESLVPKGFYPDALLFLEIAPDLVDVNVHPRKSEVKFLKERDVFLAVRGAIQSAMKPERDISAPDSSSSWTLRASPESHEKNFQRPIFNGNASIPNFPRELNLPLEGGKRGVSYEDETPFPKSIEQKSNRRILGQIQNSFILIEEDDGLLIVDQHAAHERVRYEKLMKQMRDRTVESQKLLIPQVIESSPSERKIFEAFQDIFTDLGFELQEFGDREMIIFAVPAGTEKVDFSENLKNLLHDLEAFAPEEGKAVSKAAERIATFAACRGAIKFGDKLNIQEMEQLISDLESCDGMYACAHGRPVAMKVPYEEMRRKCGR